MNSPRPLPPLLVAQIVDLLNQLAQHALHARLLLVADGVCYGLNRRDKPFGLLAVAEIEANACDDGAGCRRRGRRVGAEDLPAEVACQRCDAGDRQAAEVRSELSGGRVGHARRLRLLCQLWPRYFGER